MHSHNISDKKSNIQRKDCKNKQKDISKIANKILLMKKKVSKTYKGK